MSKREQIEKILLEFVRENDAAQNQLNERVVAAEYKTGMESFVKRRVDAHLAAVEKLSALIKP